MLIPNDILVEILLRLPAKSLLRFRWACKYWFDLISKDSSFVKMHLHHSTAHNEIFSIISPCLLSATSYHVDRNKIFQCYLNYNNTTRVGDGSSKVSIGLPFEDSIGCRSRILGSCNGLILFYQILNNNLCIWNLCTKEYKLLPDPLKIQGVTPDNSCSDMVLYNYAFGYDHTNDDYKVLRDRYYDEVDSYSDVQVYTLRTNSWRMIEPNPYRLHLTHQFTQGVFLNGVVYWMDFWVKNIISFDFGTEKFQHMTTMSNVGGRDYRYMRLRVFEGSLCVVLKINNQPDYYEIWLMNDNGVNNNNESLWIKVFTVPSLYQIHPLRYTWNGEILMLSNEKDLVLYDRKSNTTEILCRNICKEDTHYVIEVYTQSLVSLNSGTYKGQDGDDA